MKHLLSPEGRQALTDLLQGSPLFAFDFDGTLAPIVAHPAQAHVPASLSRILAELVHHHPVAIVTGRAVEDVRSRLGFEPTVIVGNHGAEGPWPHDPRSITALDALRGDLAGAAGSRLQAMGVMVEDKRQSMALHFRLARDREAAQAAIREILDPHGHCLQLFDGKLVVNVMAVDAPHKGDAVLALHAHLPVDRVFFAGDDLNDEPVFQVAQPDWVTVRVGQDRASAARFALNSPTEMLPVLELCLRLDSSLRPPQP